MTDAPEPSRDRELELFRSHLFVDEHSGGLRHCHAGDELVARRPR